MTQRLAQSSERELGSSHLWKEKGGDLEEGNTVGFWGTVSCRCSKTVPSLPQADLLLWKSCYRCCYTISSCSKSRCKQSQGRELTSPPGGNNCWAWSQASPQGSSGCKRAGRCWGQDLLQLPVVEAQSIACSAWSTCTPDSQPSCNPVLSCPGAAP